MTKQHRFSLDNPAAEEGCPNRGQTRADQAEPA